MPKNTLDMVKSMSFVAKYSPQGNKMIIIVPKEYHSSISKLKNPLKVFVEEIIEESTNLSGFGENSQQPNIRKST